MRDVIGYWVHSGEVSNVTVRIPRASCDTWFHGFKIMQCTGARDRSGKLIYEGDIVNIGDRNIRYIIEWRDTGFVGKTIGTGNWIGINAWSNKIEIMSNIWESRKCNNQEGEK